MTFTKLPKAISAEELLSTPLPPVKWIIPGLLPAGLALFAGPSKAGKSWLTLWLCLQIAQGNPVWNREIEPRTVIYFSLEDTFNRLQNRIFQLIDGGDAPERLILQTECPSIGQGLEEQIDSLIYTYSDVGMIVIDTLQKVRVSDGNGGMYANDYKEAGALKKLADKYGICILLIHHLRKQSAADPLDAKGKAGVLDGAGMAKVAEHGQEFCSFFLVQTVQKVGDVGVGVAKLCGSRHHLFRFRGVGDQTNSHHRVILPP